MPLRERLRVTVRALPAMAVPFVVLTGIYGGFMTVTESAAMAAVTSLLVSLIVYRGFPFTQTLEVIAEALSQRRRHHADHRHGVGVRPLDDRLGRSRPGWWNSRSHQGFSTWEFLLAMNLLLLVIGCFLEVVSTLLLVMPILAPVLVPLGVDPVHFGIIFTHNMEVGLVHPPVGLNLFVLSTISDAPMGEVIRGILPFLVLLLCVLGLITYWPAMTLWLPNLVFGK